MTEDKKPSLGKRLGIGCLAILGIFIALGVIGAIVGDKSKPGAPAANTPAGNVETKHDAAEPAPVEQEPALTGPQENALRSAKQYLSMQGFSKKGLIQQLSADSGEGYDVADATAAVNSLNVDWNEQAARSAKQYISMQGFSCKGLIQQLSASAGEKYTLSEATYGAKQAGAC
ncbi:MULTISPECIES: Ltp family lipoprotein [unclassified Sphingomonas]|uniref:Ltp family lipoprotein n=1 Tax=Novosphingobium rhizosphaerae TaxID=1551649 RepID=UPI0015C90BFE